jgi:hypothetical protein
VHDEAALKWFAAEHARHVDAIQKIDDEIANLPEEVAHRRAVEEAKRLEERMNQQLQQQRSRIASIALQRPRI